MGNIEWVVAMKWAKALIILAILVGSLIPAGMNLAVGNTSKVETYPPFWLSATFGTCETIVAGNLPLSRLHRVAFGGNGNSPHLQDFQQSPFGLRTPTYRRLPHH